MGALQMWFVLSGLVISAPAIESQSADQARIAISRASALAIVPRIQRADYEGDRAALKRLYGDLAPVPQDDKLASRVLYWRGFALWRRAFNGFNDNADPKELEEDMQQAVIEFDGSSAKDPEFVDAKIAAGSCLSNLAFLNRKDPAGSQELLGRAIQVLKQAQAAAPDNPRLLWVLGPNRWYAPPEYGGSQEQAMALYQKGLDSVRAHKEDTSDPLQPTWGEPELLMNLAWSNWKRTKPDLKAADEYAQTALKLVPYWHYVRDILIPQIHAAQAAAH